MTCPPRFVKPKRDSYMERIPQNTPKEIPIRKRLLLQGKDFYSKEKGSSPTTIKTEHPHEQRYA